jgi:hypothetical protein
LINALRETGKRTAGWLLSLSVPLLDYRNCVLVLAHMRCGSTALSNILCSRSDVSGYGESHVRHDGQGALGRLAMNQMRRGGWKPDAPLLFDKILHSRHDRSAPPEFFAARAIFMVRRPGDAISSIVKLFAGLGRDEYATDEAAARYYIDRLHALESLWGRFPAECRMGITHEALLLDPDGELAKLSARLYFDPPLANRYVSLAASRKGGGGDPVVSGLHDRIESKLAKYGRDDARPAVPACLMADAWEGYRRLCALFDAAPTASEHRSQSPMFGG